MKTMEAPATKPEIKDVKPGYVPSPGWYIAQIKKIAPNGKVKVLLKRFDIKGDTG